MKKALFILLTACLMASCSDPNENYVKKAVRIMDRNGIYAQGPEWEKTKAEALAANPSSLEEAQKIVMQVGKVAGGKHTFLMTADEVMENDTADWEMPTIELLENGIASIKLPQFMGNAEDGIRYANTVLNALPNTLQGAIIDLRGNRGGNMYPMIAAVHRFLPNDNIIQLRTRRNNMKINVEYVLRIANVVQQTHIDCPVALLTDEWTGSSGEAVLLCFRGMENARTFGSPTAGYASCNQPFNLPGGSQLILTTGEDVARTGEVFCDDPIEPDVLTEMPFEAALEWINNNIKSKNMENEMKFCQSCGMPLTKEILGTNADGSKNEDYCMYCYKDGKFLQDCTMDEMIEHCAQFVDEVNKGLPQPITKEEYIGQMKMYFPHLKRWRTELTINEDTPENPALMGIKDLITKMADTLPITFISSVDEEGFPWTKAMLSPRVREGIKVFYFTTNTFSLRVAHYKANPKASIYFCDEEGFKGMMLRGTMEVLTDAKSKEMIWRDGDTEYYPDGVTDPNYCVLKFTATDGRFYSDFYPRSFVLE